MKSILINVENPLHISIPKPERGRGVLEMSAIWRLLSDRKTKTPNQMCGGRDNFWRVWGTGRVSSGIPWYGIPPEFCGVFICGIPYSVDMEFLWNSVFRVNSVKKISAGIFLTE